MVNTSSTQNPTSRGCSSMFQSVDKIGVKRCHKIAFLGGWFELCPFRPKEKNLPFKRTKPFLAKIGQNCVLLIPPLFPCCGHESILLDQPRLLSPVCVCVYFVRVSFCMLHVFPTACLCLHLQLPSVLVAQMASHSILRVCVCLPCCVCMSLCVCVSLCLFLLVCMCVHFLPPVEVFVMHMASLAKAMCVCPCVFVSLRPCVFCLCVCESLCLCVYICLHVIPSLWWWCTWPDGPRLRESLSR